MIDELYAKGYCEVNPLDRYENEFCLIKEGKYEVPTRYMNGKLYRLDRDIEFNGIRPANAEQVFAMHVLKDASVECVVITGRARSGKTLIATDYALYAVKNKYYERVIATRPNVELGHKLGYLPGDIDDKFRVYLEPFYDCAAVLGERSLIDYYRDTGLIEPVPIPYMKGRSFNNSIILVDEAEDLTIEELQILLTRAGKGSKVILCGDIKQLDNPQNKGRSPLEYMIQKFRGLKLFAHVHFNQNMGAKLAMVAYDLLDRDEFNKRRNEYLWL